MRNTKNLLQLLIKSFLQGKIITIRKRYQILEEMILYALKHFTTEEIYMVKFKYPEYHAHTREHQVFTMKAVDYCYRATKDDCQITDDLLEYLQQWLVEHIQETDKKYTDFFNKIGLK
jgi:hemerythrin